MKGKNRQNDKTIKPLSKLAMGSGIFIATIVLALLSFISLELAMLTFGVMSISAIVFFESRRRAFWELGAAFQFKHLRDQQKSTDKDLLRYGVAIDALKEEMKETRAALKSFKNTPAPAMNIAPPAQAEKPQPPSEKPSRALNALLDAVEANKNKLRRPSPAPLAIKPGQMIEEPPAIQTTGANTIEDYDGLSDTVVRELLGHALSNKRVDVFVQPIVRLPQRQARFYEVFARIRARPGQYLPAAKYMPIAEQDNVQNEIDNLLLLQCLQTIEASAHLEKAAPFFLNITTSTLSNGMFMKRLLGFLTKNRPLARRLVFEMAQNEFANAPAGVLEIIKGLGKLGCSFSLDHVSDLEFDIYDLQDYKIRYVKIDAKRLYAPTKDASKEFAWVHRAKRKLEANAIGVIVEKIETEEQMRELLDYDVHYGQGYLFGKPDLQGAYANRARARRSGPDDERKVWA